MMANPFIEAVLDSLPRGLESLSIGVPPGTEFAAVDTLLKTYLAPNRFAHLKRLRLLRLRGEGVVLANGFNRTDAAVSIPLTASVCEDRNIECVIWH